MPQFLHLIQYQFEQIFVQKSSVCVADEFSETRISFPFAFWEFIIYICCLIGIEFGLAYVKYHDNFSITCYKRDHWSEDLIHCWLVIVPSCALCKDSFQDCSVSFLMGQFWSHHNWLMTFFAKMSISFSRRSFILSMKNFTSSRVKFVVLFSGNLFENAITLRILSMEVVSRNFSLLKKRKKQYYGCIKPFLWRNSIFYQMMSKSRSPMFYRLTCLLIVWKISSKDIPNGWQRKDWRDWQRKEQRILLWRMWNSSLTEWMIFLKMKWTSLQRMASIMMRSELAHQKETEHSWKESLQRAQEGTITNQQWIKFSLQWFLL